MIMNPCPACRRKVQDGAKECPYCGMVFAEKDYLWWGLGLCLGLALGGYYSVRPKPYLVAGWDVLIRYGYGVRKARPGVGVSHRDRVRYYIILRPGSYSEPNS